MVCKMQRIRKISILRNAFYAANYAGLNEPLPSNVITEQTFPITNPCQYLYPIWEYVAWSSLVEGDEQLDRPNSQTTMELCHACVA